MASSGALLELFTALQGEGVLTGTPMLFLRFSGCRVGCRFCDTRRSWRTSSKGLLRWGGEDSREGAEPFQNPVGTAQVLKWADAFRARNPALAWASLTGGEPLEQPGFAAALAGALKREGWKVYLETAGLHPGALRRAAPCLDFVSMDWKLGMPDAPRRHRAFLKSLGRRKGQVKAVVTSLSRPREVAQAARAVSVLRPDLPFILQKLTPIGRLLPPEPARLDALAAAAGSVRDLRLLTQAHRS